MKKIFSVALLAFVFAASANAQLKLGVKGGLNVTDMSLSKEVFDASNQTGYFFGPTIKFSLPIVGLGVDAAALYDHRSAKVKVDGDPSSKTEETLKQNQVIVPINLRYGIGLGDSAEVFLFAGPQFGFNVGDKEQKIWNQAAEWKLKTSNFSVNVGLGATVLSHLQVSASYNIACGKTGDIEASDVLKTVVKNKEDVKNNAWQIAVAYYF